MQKAIPYSNGGHQVIIGGGGRRTSFEVAPCSVSDGAGIRKVVEENAVVVVGRRGCCMVHVVKQLLLGQGVNPTVCEVGDDADEGGLIRQLSQLMTTSERGQQQQLLFPAVFIGGRLVGGLDRLMAVHISGDLVPILKDAGALWL